MCVACQINKLESTNEEKFDKNISLPNLVVVSTAFLLSFFREIGVNVCDFLWV